MERENTPAVNDYRLNVGWKIKGVRELMNISQDYIASKLGIKQPALSKIENGELITFERLCEIAAILQINVNMIVNFNKDVVFNSCTQSGMQNYYHYNNTEDVKSIYDQLIEEKNARIVVLEKLIAKLQE